MSRASQCRIKIHAPDYIDIRNAFSTAGMETVRLEPGMMLREDVELQTVPAEVAEAHEAISPEHRYFTSPGGRIVIVHPEE